MIDRERLERRTVRVLAEWDTLVENEHGFGPVIELELGYRAAAYFLGGRVEVLDWSVAA